MRVLHLTPEFPPVIWGGLGTAVGGLVTASARAGMTVGVLLVGGVLVVGDGAPDYGSGWHPAWPGEKEQGGAVDREGIRFFHVAPQEATRTGLRLARRWRPDVIHLHSAWLWPTARAIHEQTGAPIVFTVHSLDRAEYEIGQFITHWDLQDEVIHAADRLISLSRGEEALLLHYCPEVADRIRIVGNGIEDAPLPSRQRSVGASPVVLYSGRFVDRKGIRELLAAIPVVLAAAPKTRFVLVGGYGGGAEIERCWMDDALRPWRDQVHFTGWLTPGRVAAWYRSADVLLVPSWYEPFGMVVLEGMLHGLALVACAVGGPAEILEHERTALLVPPQDASALAGAVLRLVTDEELLRRLAAAAAEEVRRRWLWPRIVEKMAAVYDELVTDRAAERLHELAATTGPASLLRSKR